MPIKYKQHKIFNCFSKNAKQLYVNTTAVNHCK